MKCPKCDFDNPNEMQFCGKCGSKLIMPCPKCGSVNPPEFQFCGKCGTKIAEDLIAEIKLPKLEDMQDKLYIPEPLRQRMDNAKQELQGENRLVTALFADISGFTPLSNRHSNEKVVDIVNQCFKVIIDTVFRYEGDPNRFIGDSVLAFFGAPIAHENDPERAIMAALEIRDKVKELSLNVSIGINTGMMYFGPIGTSDHHEISAYGPDINLAKRLQEYAGSGQILVGPGTHKFAKRAFDFQQTSSLTLKGIDKSTIAFEALRQKIRPEKLRGIEGLYADMIGREKEFAEIMDAVDSWFSGHGQIINVIGEAGIGKSRLVRELKKGIDRKGELYLWLEGRCLSIGQPVSYWPFIDMFRTLFNLEERDSESEASQKVRDVILKLFPTRAVDILPFIGHLMSVKFGDELDRKLESYTSEQIRHQMMVRLRDVFVALAKEKPLLLIFEDLHWSDDLSLDLISMLMDELITSPIMLICVYRPEKDHRCSTLSTLAQRKCFESYTELQIQKLTKIQSSRLVQALLAIDCLSDEVREMILVKSEGNPFFIEEVIRSLMDKGLISREGESWIAREKITNIDVPDTIHGVIMERVDRLESETKYVLQCASVIGRLFRYNLLSHLTSHERELDGYMQELENKDLVYEERSIPELEYTFKHALTQEATYQTILSQRRKGFHHHVAEGIEGLYNDKIEDFYEELAYHYKISDDVEKTIEYLIKAGVKSASNFANQDAVKYFDEAEELIGRSKLPHREDKSLLYENRGQALQYIGNWTKALKDYEEALKWCDDPHSRAEIYRKMGWLEAEELQDKTRAQKHLELGLKELPEDDRSIEMVRLMIDLLWTIMDMIGFNDVISRGLKAIKIAEEMSYKQELAILYAYMDFWHIKFEDYSGEYEKKAMSIIDELSDNPKMAWACFILGSARNWHKSKWSKIEEIIPYYNKAMEIAKHTGYIYMVGYVYVCLGDVYSGSGQKDKAIENYNLGIEMIAITKGQFPLMFAKNLMLVYAEQDHDDMVVSTFCRIMQIYNSIEFDDTSHGVALLNRGMLIWTYYFFYLSYIYMDKRSEFKHIALKNLNELMAGTNSQIQKAWYHYELMLLNLELNNKDTAENHAQEVISIFEKFGCPDYMSVFHFAYLMLGDVNKAVETVTQYMNMICNDDSHIMDDKFIYSILEFAYLYTHSGYYNIFRELAEKIQEKMPERLRRMGLSKLVIEPIDLVESGQPQFIDNFEQDPIDTGWEWIDSSGDSSYEWGKGYGIQISVPIANTAYLLKTLSGDFSIETVISNGSRDQKNGTIYIQTDRKESIMLHTYSGRYTETIAYQAYLDGQYKNTCVYPFNSEKIWLRIERLGDRFSGYVSSDGENWFSCGYIDAKIGNSVKVGIRVSFPLLKQDSTRFEYFKIYGPDEQSDS
jgi:class 3 adenylate cyclase/tetratricopeptide (TPR) repeat protein